MVGCNGWESVYEAHGPQNTSDMKTIYRLGYSSFTGGWGMNADGGQPDSALAGTLVRHGNYDYVNDAVVWNPNLPHTIPISFYLTNKPSFFGSCAWPAYGPEENPTIGTLPAKDREDGTNICGTERKLPPAQAPTKLRRF